MTGFENPLERLSRICRGEGVASPRPEEAEREAGARVRCGTAASKRAACSEFVHAAVDAKPRGPRSGEDSSRAVGRESDVENVGRDVPARLRKLYESHDGKLCLFECGEGHLAAVDASKLA